MAVVATTGAFAVPPPASATKCNLRYSPAGRPSTRRPAAADPPTG